MTPTPNLFIIGAPKSGTTSLYEYLKGHPEIFMSVVKEPCYFSRDLALDDSGNFLVYERDKDALLRLVRGCRRREAPGRGIDALPVLEGSAGADQRGVA